jgi:hypothetical protein
MCAIHRLNHLLDSHEGRQEDQHARASIRGHVTSDRRTDTQRGEAFTLTTLGQRPTDQQ